MCVRAWKGTKRATQNVTLKESLKGKGLCGRLVRLLSTPPLHCVVSKRVWMWYNLFPTTDVPQHTCPHAHITHAALTLSCTRVCRCCPTTDTQSTHASTTCGSWRRNITPCAPLPPDVRPRGEQRCRTIHAQYVSAQDRLTRGHPTSKLCHD